MKTPPYRQCCRAVLVLFVSLVGWWADAPAIAGTAKCKLAEIVEFPITMSGLRPMLNAKINGNDIRLSLDSGAFYSMISPASAAELKLHTYPAPPSFYVEGIGGRIHVDVANANSFYLNGVSLHHVDFIVGGNDETGQSIGLLGRNFLQIADAEFDLGQGVVRLMSAQDCDDVVLAYWAHAGDSFSVMDIDAPQKRLLASHKTKAAERSLEPITGSAFVNGVKIRVIFDTGATTSYLTAEAAARAGIKAGSPGATAAGYGSGIGRGEVANYIAPVSSFKIGDEEIRNTRLRIGYTQIKAADMLIGADFFLSHHIYVANSQHKLYFTYNGGAVFNLKTILAASTVPAPAAAPNGRSTDPASSVQNPVGSGSQSVAEPSAGARASDLAAVPIAATDANASAAPKKAEEADESARRGAAFAARREFDQALPALSRACELAPDNSDYFYQRGSAYWEIRQPSKALADFGRALELKPDHVLALVARAELRIQTGDKAGALTDLGAANAAIPSEDAEHYSLAAGYTRLGELTRSIEQYDLWIASHPADVKLYRALNGRCRARALVGSDLSHALDDCNRALTHAITFSPLYADVAYSRGLVWLRLGHYDKSISDFNASLSARPLDPWSLYGRGIGKIRAKKVSEGEADIAQAKGLSADIGDSFGRYGILP